MGHDCPLNAFANDVKDAFFLSSSFHWHPLSRQASYCVSEVPWQGCHACRSWGVSLPGVGEGGKAPCSEVTSQTQSVSSELGPHSSLKARTRLPWQRPQSSLTQLKSVSWEPFLKDYRFNTFKYKQQPCRQGREAEQSYVARRILEELW